MPLVAALLAELLLALMSPCLPLLVLRFRLLDCVCGISFPNRDECMGEVLSCDFLEASPPLVDKRGDTRPVCVRIWHQRVVEIDSEQREVASGRQSVNMNGVLTFFKSNWEQNSANFVWLCLMLMKQR